MDIKGTLIPIGGNEDKGSDVGERYHLEYIEASILSRVVRESGGIDACIGVITTASSIPEEVAKNYLHAFSLLGCSNVHIMDIRTREQAEHPDNMELLKKADCIMFSGGNQSKIIRKIGNTRFHNLLRERFYEEPLVIAGTSAGAMCMSTEMIGGGSSKESLIKGAVSMLKGMQLIPNLIIDSHFIQRGRFGRLAEAVAKFPVLIGVGLAEDTGMVIKNGQEFEIIGSGMVILFDPRDLRHNNEKILPAGTPMTLVNLKVHVLTNGDRFHISRRRVKVLPLNATLIKA